MEVGFKSDKGIRRANNEDACFVLLPDKLCIVADGVGGGNSGEIASRTCVNEIANSVKNNPISKVYGRDGIVNYFERVIAEANKKIFDMARTYQENTGMATTLAIVYVRDGNAFIVNVGDSRVYVYRGGKLQQLTEDHTYVNTLVKAGVLTAVQAQNDERKNIITKALGAEEKIEPDYFQVEIKKDDIFIICTDGLYDEVGSIEMTGIINRSSTMSELSRELISCANKNGGRDNITIISLRITEDDLSEQ